MNTNPLNSHQRFSTAKFGGRYSLPGAALPAVLVAACLTVNVYFPEAEIKDLSERIEQAIAQQAKEQAGESSAALLSNSPLGSQLALNVTDSWRSSRAPGAASTVAFASREPAASRRPASASTPTWTRATATAVAVTAQVPEPEITNPAIRKIIDSRAGRLAALQRLKDLGAIGEARDASLVVRDADKVSDLRQRAEMQRLLKEENADREALYQEIAKAKGVDMSQIDRIRETYAGTLRAQARLGDWLQLEDGRWIQKTAGGSAD